MESQEAGFPPFPHSLEIPLVFPHSHGLDCGHVSKVNNKRKARKPDLRPFHRKGLVADVPGPKCSGCSGTLTGNAGCSVSRGWQFFSPDERLRGAVCRVYKDDVLGVAPRRVDGQEDDRRFKDAGERVDDAALEEE